MFSRKIRIAILVALTVCGAAPPIIEAQTKKKTTTTRRRVRRRNPNRPPAVPVVRYTVLKSSADVASTLSGLTGKTRGGTWGAMVVSLTRGDTLYAENAGEEMQPASTMKLFTSAIAFERFGPNYQFSTDALRDGPVGPDGTLTGNIYLRGDGDPALSGKFLTGGPSAPMSRLADMVAQQGIKHVTGAVVGDASAFDDQKIPDGWLTRYLQASYAARVSALSLNENLIAVSVSPTAPGQLATVVLEPSTSAIPLVANVRTVSGGGARLGFRKLGNGTIQANGSIGSRTGTRKYVYIVDDPAAFATGAFINALIARGIKVDGGIRLGKSPPGATKVASLRSPPLASMIAAMNRESINHYAELLFRNAARGPKRDVVGSVQTASSVLDEFFATKVGADTTRLVFADGSGLSILDRVTPRAQVQLLGYAHRASWGPWLHSSLPVAGDSELLRRRMRNTPAEGNLHAKTGTTNDVIALAGYVTAVNGEVLAFSFLYNGRDRWTAKSMIDVMSESLASFAR
ncbi:MAG TPA: D-alanyl-D-alanine carboxypeptidase/D-alanyl-D-alanine-endopeptidase [Gemmatimonadaceae bacterium]|jgi:D-alanyl-D-alanine carboxypeptidase/D-alanyl-D-alanine-endopeptidase (penicillin-binding protein 4)